MNTKKIINQIRIERQDFAWVGIEFKGTNAIVKIVKASSKPETVDENYFCNIVANKDAKITKITTKNGTALVTVGTEVKKGDILIAGWMQGEHTEKYFVNASGEIKGEINYSQTEKIMKKEVKREQTGKKEKKFSIKINNFKINLYKKFSKFKKYDTIVAEKNLKLFKNFYLPITIIENTNFEVNETEENRNYEQAKELGELTAKGKLNALNFEKLQNQETEVEEKEDCFEVKVTYQVIEEIGTKEKI